MIYLASPYSHPDPLVREQRYRDACRATVDLMLAGQLVYSPIVFGHPLVAHGLPTDWSFWAQADCHHMAHCTEVAILPLDGWEASVGISWEMNIARELGKPVRFLNGQRSARG